MGYPSRVQKSNGAQKLVHNKLHVVFLERACAGNLPLQVGFHVPHNNEDRLEILGVVAGLKNITKSYDVWVWWQLLQFCDLSKDAGSVSLTLEDIWNFFDGHE